MVNKGKKEDSTVGKVHQSKIGPLLISISDEGISGLELPRPGQKAHTSDEIPLTEGQRKIFGQATDQIDQYFRGERRTFELPLVWDNMGAFQRKVLKATLAIPHGKTSSYGKIASKVGSPKAYQAVGTALAKNPLPILIPCHRVLKSNGEVGGFMGMAQGLPLKKQLLDLETNHD